jgi:hypothetical protein
MSDPVLAKIRKEIEQSLDYHIRNKMGMGILLDRNRLQAFDRRFMSEWYLKCPKCGYQHKPETAIAPLCPECGERLEVVSPLRKTDFRVGMTVSDGFETFKVVELLPDDPEYCAVLHNERNGRVACIEERGYFETE